MLPIPSVLSKLRCEGPPWRGVLLVGRSLPGCMQ